jgi:hypothetical protein
MILSRRNLIELAAAALAPWSIVRALAASDFWNTKDPDAWSADEIAKLLKKSPWAKEVTGERFTAPKNTSTSDPSMTSPYPRAGSRSSRNNPMGLPGGNPRNPKPPSPGSSGKTYKATVVWESAKVIRDAAKSPLPDGFENQYVLSVAGIPLAKSSSRNSLDIVRQVTMLTLKGHDPLEAGTIQQNRSNGAIYYFGFSKEALAITKDDKEVVFTTAMGKVHFTAKFSPKEMLYRGELAI